jgi:hypothetical protein
MEAKTKNASRAWRMIPCPNHSAWQPQRWQKAAVMSREGPSQTRSHGGTALQL